VVLGAAADEVSDILRLHGWLEDDDVAVLVNDDWSSGMSSSLRAGLSTLDGDAALVTLVDLPDVGDSVVSRLVELAAVDALARATYGDRPGHPVLIGQAHWAGVEAVLEGDRGARRYLDSHGVRDVPCDDLATGRDLDRPEDLQV
jgi:nicotine blue oxidoreductase